MNEKKLLRRCAGSDATAAEAGGDESGREIESGETDAPGGPEPLEPMWGTLHQDVAGVAGVAGEGGVAKSQEDGVWCDGFRRPPTKRWVLFFLYFFLVHFNFKFRSSFPEVFLGFCNFSA